MENRSSALAAQAEVQEFLTSRRARITPDAAGLPTTGNRRVPGLRRSEVADLARFQFLDPASREFYPDWDTMARMCVGVMHAEVGRNPGHRGLQVLVGELSTHSEDFAELWAVHDVRIHGAGTKRFHHPEVGELTLAFEELQVTADDGLALYVYSAEPGSASEEKLRLLASRSATVRSSGTTRSSPR